MMKLLAVCFTLLVAAQAFPRAQEPITDDVLAIARWSAPKMEIYTEIEGDYTVLTVRNLKKTTVGTGANYEFTLDLLVQTPEYQYLFRSCDLTVYDQPSINVRQIVGTPKCGPHPNYQ